MEPQVLPQERIAKVRPFWETVPQEERLNLLSIPLSELKQRAAEVGARQRKEQGGQAASTCGLVVQQWGSSRDLWEVSTAGS